MGFGKILLGAVVGVGAIAAAPFTGGGSLLGAATLIGSLSGAGAIAGAVAAGTVGALAGAAVSDMADEEKSRVRKEGVKVGEVIAGEKYNQKINDLTAKLKEMQNFEYKIVGLFAVGIAIANADGYMQDEEREDLKSFVAGISVSSLPTEIKEQVNILWDNPPDFNQAIKAAKRYDCSVEDIDEVIQCIAMSDGSINVDEQAFITKWNELKPQIAQ